MSGTRSTAVSDLKSHIGFWMRFVSNHVSQAFAAQLLRTGITVQTLQPSARRAGFGILEAGLSYYFGDTTPARPDATN